MKKIISVFVLLSFCAFNSYAQQVSSDMRTLLSGEGRVLYGDEPNSLMVMDYPENLDRISQYLEILDVSPQQVLIEARVIEVRLQDQHALGINWSLLASQGGLKVGGYRLLSDGSTSLDQNLPLLPVYPKPGDKTSNLDPLSTAGLDPFTMQVFSNDINAVLKTVASSLDTDVLSAPRIVSVNNRAADIRIIQSYPWVEPSVTLSDTGVTTVSWKIHFEEIGIILRVTPTINPDGNISMVLNPDISEFVGTKELKLKTGPLITDVLTYDIPIIDKRNASTKVIVGTGETLIFGGLIKDKLVKNEIKVPLMGDLPFIGRLFKTANSLKEKTELLILVSPTIINENEKTNMAKQLRYGVGNKYTVDKERQDKMILTMENKEIRKKVDLNSQWDALAKKQQALADKTKELEKTVLSEENNLKKLEEAKEAVIVKKHNLINK
jgi:type II secretory pathway component GspD/PulD (secretin)